MKLLIDIGNTNTSIAISDGGKVRKEFFLHTMKKEVNPRSFKRLLGTFAGRIDEAVIVSVVPAFLSVVKKSLKAVVPHIKVRTVGKDIKVPIKVKYKDPREVGQDRLVIAYAAKISFKAPILVIDFGTAVTFDLVGARGAYEGGLIFPGLRLALGSLVENAALLPKIVLKPTRGLIGRDTKSSMNKGILMGYASMCDGIIERFKDKYGKQLKVVATGGDAGLIARYSSRIEEVSPDLIFKGLSLLADTIRK